MPGEDFKQLLQQAWWVGVNAVKGDHLVAQVLTRINEPGFTHVLAVGKAAGSMMQGVISCQTDEFSGLVITKYDHLDKNLNNYLNLELIESGHPIPDENSLYAGERAVRFVESIDARGRLLVLISGGASSLVELPEAGKPLEDLIGMNNDLIASGKTIAQINAVRSAISQVKAGKLLDRCVCQSVTVLAISDVRGDDINIIGSGIGACSLPNSQSLVIGTNTVARDSIATFFERQGTPVHVNEESLYGDLYQLAERVAKSVMAGQPGVYLYGGEPVIELPPAPGTGGRNQSLALAMAKHIQNQSGIVVLVAGTDGTDGPTHAAGGIIDGQTFSKAEGAEKALLQADAGTYLEGVGELFVSGPTGTNVMDILLAVKQ